MTYSPLDLVENYIGRFVAYPSDHARAAHVLWIAHAHLIECFETTPRLAFMSAEKESGKTRALEVTALLVPDPILSISASPAVIVRLVSAGKPTILYDEIDAVFGNARAQEANGDLCAILNGGYRRGAKVYRCVTHGKKVETEALDAFAPVAVAGLRTLPDTLASRAVVIRMQRRAPGELVEAFRYRFHASQGEQIRDELAEWAEEHAANIGAAEPALPHGIQDRAADCWEPLVAIADEAGGDWPERAGAAAVHFNDKASDDTLTRGVELLRDIRDAFGNDSRLSIKGLLDRLIEKPEAPWGDLGGHPLNVRGLSQRIKEYGIKSNTVRLGEHTAKGYLASDFADAWCRYLPAKGSSNTGNAGHIIDNENKVVTDVTDVTAFNGKGDDFEERASILQFDAGLSRDEAEAQADRELSTRWRVQ